MAQDLEEISSLIKSIKDDNLNNSSIFGALLNAISTKLDNMAEENETLDLMKVYLTEITSALKSEHDFTDERFKKLENVVSDFENKLSYDSGGGLTKTDIINFVTDIKEEFSALDGKIADIYNTYNPTNTIKEIKNLITGLPTVLKDEQRPQLQIIEQNIQLLSDTLVGQLSDYEKGITKTISEIKSQVKEFNNTEALQTSLFESMNDIHQHNEKKFQNLEKITSGFGASLFDMDQDIRAVLKALEQTGGTEAIKQSTENISAAVEKAMEAVSAGINGLKPEFEIIMDKNAQKVIDALENNASIENLRQYIEGLGLNMTGLEEKLTAYMTADAGLEIQQIKTELEQLREYVAALDAGLGEKLAAIVHGMSVDINLGETEQKLNQLLEQANSSPCFDAIEEKISQIAQEVSLVNTDLAQVLEGKYKKLYEEFEPLKNDIRNFFDSGCNGIITELKSLLMSGFTEDIIDEMKVQVNNVLNNSPMSIGPVMEVVGEINTKLDVMAISDETYFTEINDQLCTLLSNEHELSEVLRVVHGKIDLLMLNEEDDLAPQINEIKKLISEQRKILSSVMSKEKITEIEQRLDNVGSPNELHNVKESILGSIAAVFEQISFVEESEDIKDFVEEKTGEINQSLAHVTDQLKKLVTEDYSYTLQDVESDIAKLKMLLQQGSIESLPEDMSRIAQSIENLSSSLTQEQVCVLKDSFEKVNDDIMSISARTNKILINSDESGKILSNTLKQFDNVISNLESRIKNTLNERIEQKLERLNMMALEKARHDKVVHQVLSYLGEWVDNISDKLNEISKPRQAVSQEFDIEELYEKQQNRMDRLEKKLEQVLSMLEDDSVATRKLDKIERQVSKLSADVEKLAAYVD
jgi:hypothetical protein